MCLINYNNVKILPQVRSLIIFVVLILYVLFYSCICDNYGIITFRFLNFFQIDPPASLQLICLCISCRFSGCNKKNTFSGLYKVRNPRIFSCSNSRINLNNTVRLNILFIFYHIGNIRHLYPLHVFTIEKIPARVNLLLRGNFYKLLS